jgi:hypothetical protein
MFSTCIFCGGALGRNEVIEEFTVGRRLAFDPARGRLWALCPGCRQWNLSPLEERWEALESLERISRDTRARYSTGEISLVRHPDGLDLVRIGRPQLPEYAAWRYGTELVRRRRRHLLVGATVGVGGGAVLIGGVTAGLVVGSTWLAFNTVNFGLGFYRTVIRTQARVELPHGGTALLKERHAQAAALAEEEGRWQLRFPYVDAETITGLRGLRNVAGSARLEDDPVAVLEGQDAARAAGKILPALNKAGGSGKVIREATRFIEETATVDGAFQRALATRSSAWRDAMARMSSPAKALYRLPGPVRLGLEMAAHEETERRALEGELAALEAEWRAAEEIAAIADDLLIPGRIRRRIQGARRGRS